MQDNCIKCGFYTRLSPMTGECLGCKGDREYAEKFSKKLDSYLNNEESKYESSSSGGGFFSNLLGYIIVIIFLIWLFK